MDYVSEVIAQTKLKNPDQPEFMQTVTEVLTSIRPAVEKNEKLLRKYAVLERLVEPDRIICFRISWTDDKGKVNVN